MYQYSTIQALSNGFYDGQLTVGEMKTKGNLGLGTFNGLDGEMIVLDGSVYKVTVDGKVHHVPNGEQTPFVNIVDFNGAVAQGKAIQNFSDLEILLQEIIVSKNLVAAFRIDGSFDYIKVRSVAKQERPYPKLMEALQTQKVFEYSDLEGTVLGFWQPEMMSSINLSGFHFHFISSDRSKGGHLLDCTIQSPQIKVEQFHKIELELPTSEEFKQMPLSVTKQSVYDPKFGQ